MTFDLEDGTHLLVAGNNRRPFEDCGSTTTGRGPTAPWGPAFLPATTAGRCCPPASAPVPAMTSCCWPIPANGRAGDRRSCGSVPRVHRPGVPGRSRAGTPEVLPDTTLLKLGNAGAVARVAGGWDDLRITFTGTASSCTMTCEEAWTGPGVRPGAYRLREGRVFPDRGRRGTRGGAARLSYWTVGIVRGCPCPPRSHR